MNGWVQASREAGEVDRLAIWLLAASVAIVALVTGLIATFLVRYRRGSAASRAPLRVAEWKVEAAWIGATTLGFLGFFFAGAKVYVRMEDAASGSAREIRVVARQWMWDIRQPNGRREFGTLHVPVGVRVRLRLTSEDVIHSFFVPAFRVKQDVVPGKEVLLAFTPTRAGRFALFCTEYCGSKHAEMTGAVLAQAPADYAAWLAEGRLPGAPVEAGRRLFVRHGCSGCHEGASAVRAPPLQGLHGTRVALADGSFVRADGAYLRDCILAPEKVRLAGYAPLMPSFRGVIGEGDLAELLLYLENSPP